MTLIVDACKKTIATVDGDEYDEIVLYFDANTQRYWFHTYQKYVYMQEGSHASYTVASELAERGLTYIRDHDLTDSDRQRKLR